MKALYRMARAQKELGEFDEARKSIGLALGVEPGNAAVRQLEQALAREQQVALLRTKRVSKSIVRAMAGDGDHDPRHDAPAEVPSWKARLVQRLMPVLVVLYALAGRLGCIKRVSRGKSATKHLAAANARHKSE